MQIGRFVKPDIRWLETVAGSTLRDPLERFWRTPVETRDHYEGEIHACLRIHPRLDRDRCYRRMARRPPRQRLRVWSHRQHRHRHPRRGRCGAACTAPGAPNGVVWWQYRRVPARCFGAPPSCRNRAKNLIAGLDTAERLRLPTRNGTIFWRSCPGPSRLFRWLGTVPRTAIPASLAGSRRPNTAPSARWRILDRRDC